MSIYSQYLYKSDLMSKNMLHFDKPLTAGQVKSQVNIFKE